jgi:hypothetical protein
LRFPASAIAGEFVYKYDGISGPALFIVELDGIVGLDMRHINLPLKLLPDLTALAAESTLDTRLIAIA